MSPDNKSMRRLVETKSKFDHLLERLLQELSELNLNMVSGTVNNPTRVKKRKIGKYFPSLQMELSKKIKELLEFQTQVNGWYNTILKLNEFTMFQEDPQMDIPDEGDNRFIPDKKFLSRPLARYQFTTGTDNISDQVVKELKIYLESGGNYSTHWEPVGWMCLMMDRYTGLAYRQLVGSRVPPDTLVSTDTLVEWFRELLKEAPCTYGGKGFSERSGSAGVSEGKVRISNRSSPNS